MTKDEWLEQTTAAIQRLSDRSTSYRGLPSRMQPAVTIDDYVLYQELEPTVAGALLLMQRLLTSVATTVGTIR